MVNGKFILKWTVRNKKKSSMQAGIEKRVTGNFGKIGRLRELLISDSSSQNEMFSHIPIKNSGHFFSFIPKKLRHVIIFLKNFS
jgi:hypothetical protein